MKRKPWSERLAQKGEAREEYPIGTVAFYGPTNRHASKVAVGVFYGPEGSADELERWVERKVEDPTAAASAKPIECATLIGH